MAESLAERYAKSVEYLARAEAVIPLGSQTFSKSRTQYPVGAAPLFASRSQGSHTWDIDGNEYVDLVCSLGAVALGYGDEEINEAVVRQLRDGVTLSLAHPIEAEVAERLVDLVPCAERVRFAKNGTDATSAAVRLARAFTGREHVVVCGYHGWQDWYIGSTSMHRGVPDRTRSLTHAIPYNDAEALEAVIADYPDQIAAMIMEPMTSTFPVEGYLEAVRRITAGARHRAGVRRDADRFPVRSGRRAGVLRRHARPCCVRQGAVQRLPALCDRRACGHPRCHAHDVLQRDVRWRDALPRRGARWCSIATPTGEPTRQLAATGQSLLDAVEARPARRSPVTFLTFSGHPTWVFQQWHIDDPEILAQAKTLLLQEMLRRGVLVLSTHEVTTVHTEDDVSASAAAYAESLTLVGEGLRSGDLITSLECEPIRPLFRVR